VRRAAARATFADEDERRMRRALALAARGRGTTSPNPMVGAVITRGGRVLAEGFHRQAGGPHAEVDALARLGRRNARGATLYVTLEPCCHVGRTGPCTEAILAAGVGRVVVGARDPNPLVDGRGVARLRRAGVRVDVGCLARECAALNAAWATWIAAGRPRVTLKVAESLDGFIADGRRRARRAPVWITGEEARAAAHELRAAHDAVLVGSGTVLADDPRLTVRLPGARGRAKGPLPVRVVLDGRLRTPPDAKVLQGGAPTIVLTARARGARARALVAAGADVVEIAAPRGRLSLDAALAALAARGIQSVLLEGGAQIHGAFIAAGLVDQVAFFLAPLVMGGGVPVSSAPARGVPAGLRLGPLSVRRVGADVLLTANVDVAVEDAAEGGR
jgi:diaminohydroxyphosphoribosylaminopyrimidine deaminase/5-amino-6-(5-phosphoribosylamino)uracil reductase